MLDGFRIFAVAATAAVAVSAASSAGADEAVIKYRQSVYEAIGGHMGALASIVTGEVAFSEDAKTHALALAALSKMPPKLFPPGSGSGKTAALPAIWEKPDDFRKAMEAFGAAAADLGKAAETDPKAVGPAVGALGKTCKNCHDSFRKEVK